MADRFPKLQKTAIVHAPSKKKILKIVLQYLYELHKLLDRAVHTI